ncbi:MAG: ribosome-associated translation inhibitor RaiA [Armatimonadetes bacterium]|nr:ribosome-associated translation inhibitor RaiA [Armatimonadota bacterium]
MELLVRNAEGNVPQSQRDYAAKRLSKLERFFKKATKVEMVHSEQKGEHRLEVTVFADNFTIRGDEHDSSLHACIDKVSDKLETRLKKLKTRIIDSHRRGGIKELPPALLEPHDSEPHEERPIIERKVFTVKDMSVEEASLQMELVDHPFFVFRNEDSGSFSVLYKRRDGNYGMLEPEL